MRGLIHIYTGDGKGKTTAAVGLGMRAWGNGMNVLMVQFLKGIETGEIKALERLTPGFMIYRRQELKKFTWELSDEEYVQMKELQEEILNYAREQVLKGGWDILILDEVMAAITTGLISSEEVVNFLKDKPHNLEIIMTGRDAPRQLIELADYVSDIRCVKHPMDKGTLARKGIEF